MIIERCRAKLVGVERRDVVEVAESQGGVESDQGAGGVGWRPRPVEVRMHESREATLRMRSLDVRPIQRLLAVRGAVVSGDEWQREFADADHADMPQAA